MKRWIERRIVDTGVAKLPTVMADFTGIVLREAEHCKEYSHSTCSTCLLLSPLVVVEK